MKDARYPLSIRFWYLIHDNAERLWHWVYRTKLGPWHKADWATHPPAPPTYHLIEEREPSEAEKARGIVKQRIYRSIGVFALLAVTGCHGIVPTQPTPFNPADFAPIVPSPPVAPPPGPHFALDLQAISSPAYADDPWMGLVSVWANQNILRPELPARVLTTCGGTTQTHPLGSGTAPFSCRLAVGVHQIGAVAEMADGRRYPTAISATVIDRPAPWQPPTPPPPAPPSPPRPRPPPAPTVAIVALELHKNSNPPAAVWRFSVDVANGTIDDAVLHFGAGATPGEATLDSDEDYVDVEYRIGGNKEIRVSATVNGETIRATRVIAVSLAP